MILTKKKKLGFTVDMVIFPSVVRVSFNEPDKKIKKYLSRWKLCAKKWKDANIEVKNGGGKCCMFDNGVAVIRMQNVPASPYDLALVQHEITHYIQFLLIEYLEMPHNRDTSECFTYCTEYLTQMIYKQLFK